MQRHKRTVMFPETQLSGNRVLFTCSRILPHRCHQIHGALLAPGFRCVSIISNYIVVGRITNISSGPYTIMGYASETIQMEMARHSGLPNQQTEGLCLGNTPFAQGQPFYLQICHLTSFYGISTMWASPQTTSGLTPQSFMERTMHIYGHQYGRTMHIYGHQYGEDHAFLWPAIPFGA